MTGKEIRLMAGRLCRLAVVPLLTLFSIGLTRLAALQSFDNALSSPLFISLSVSSPDRWFRQDRRITTSSTTILPAQEMSCG